MLLLRLLHVIKEVGLIPSSCPSSEIRKKLVSGLSNFIIIILIPRGLGARWCHGIDVRVFDKHWAWRKPIIQDFTVGQKLMYIYFFTRLIHQFWTKTYQKKQSCHIFFFFYCFCKYFGRNLWLQIFKITMKQIIKLKILTHLKKYWLNKKEVS